MPASLARVLTVAALFALASAVTAATAAAGHTVRTIGGPVFEPNRVVADTVRFAPGLITVRAGHRVTWVDRDRSPEPHTITVVTRRNLPDSFQDLARCVGCELALAHLEDPANPEESDIARVRVNVGRPGLNRQGDSLFLAPGGRISGRVSARAGTRLHYLCGVHPWMQGTIRVTAAARLAGGH